MKGRIGRYRGKAKSCWIQRLAVVFGIASCEQCSISRCWVRSRQSTPTKPSSLCLEKEAENRNTRLVESPIWLQIFPILFWSCWDSSECIFATFLVSVRVSISYSEVPLESRQCLCTLDRNDNQSHRGLVCSKFRLIMVYPVVESASSILA